MSCQWISYRCEYGTRLLQGYGCGLLVHDARWPRDARAGHKRPRVDGRSLLFPHSAVQMLHSLALLAACGVAMALDHVMTDGLMTFSMARCLGWLGALQVVSFVVGLAELATHERWRASLTDASAPFPVVLAIFSAIFFDLLAAVIAANILAFLMRK